MSVATGDQASILSLRGYLSTNCVGHLFTFLPKDIFIEYIWCHIRKNSNPQTYDVFKKVIIANLYFVDFFLRRYLKNLEFYTVSREICVTVLLNAFLLFLKRHYRRAQIWTRCFLVYEWRNNLLHIVFQKHFDKTSLQNLLAVALHKPSTMSSSFLSDYHKASNAVDGVTVCPTGFTLAHTLEEYRPWIKIDLQATFEVNSVVIYNRENCCGKFMHILTSTIFLIFFARWQTQPIYICMSVAEKNIPEHKVYKFRKQNFLGIFIG